MTWVSNPSKFRADFSLLPTPFQGSAGEGIRWSLLAAGRIKCSETIAGPVAWVKRLIIINNLRGSLPTPLAG
jgi:hypothetical protein